MTIYILVEEKDSLSGSVRIKGVFWLREEAERVAIRHNNKLSDRFNRWWVFSSKIK